MYNFYSEKEIEILKEGGKILSTILFELKRNVVEGVFVYELENKARELIARHGAEPATVGYKPFGAKKPFPSALCTSVNSEVAHGSSLDNDRLLKKGDVVSLDIVIRYKGLFLDICRTFPVGELSEEDKKLVSVARMCTNAAVSKARVGNTVSDIGEAAFLCAKKHGLNTVKELGGHGVGRKIHDRPFIPNFPSKHYKDKIQEGMLLAIEPIVSYGSCEIINPKDDEYLYITKNGSKAAQFEESVLVTKDGPLVLTKDYD